MPHFDKSSMPRSDVILWHFFIHCLDDVVSRRDAVKEHQLPDDCSTFLLPANCRAVIPK